MTLRAALNPFSAQPVCVLGVALTDVQDPALGFVELHLVLTDPAGQDHTPVYYSLQGKLCIQTYSLLH